MTKNRRGKAKPHSLHEELDRCCTCSLYPLPQLPSALLHQALRDFEICEEEAIHLIDPTVTFQFNLFAQADPRMMVGIAGAFLLKSLSTDPRPSRSWDAPKGTERFVAAVGYFSVGGVAEALDELGITNRREGIPPTIEHPDYSDSPAAYKASVRGLISRLEEKGL